MKQNPAIDQNIILRIIWGSLTSTIMILFFVLSGIKNNYHFSIPLDFSYLEKFAIYLSVLFVVSFLIHEKKIKPQKDQSARKTIYIICWSINEWVAIFSFAAVLLSQTGNLFVFGINATIALLANIYMFPKKS